MGVLSRISDAELLSQIAGLDVLEQLYDHRLAIALAGVGVWVLRKLRAYWRLRKFKGPWGTGFFGLWHCRAILSYRSHKKYQEAVASYGMCSQNFFLRLLLRSCRATLTMTRPYRPHWPELAPHLRPGTLDAHELRPLSVQPRSVVRPRDAVPGGQGPCL